MGVIASGFKAELPQCPENLGLWPHDSSAMAYLWDVMGR